jgi:hypothetical protein
VNDEPGDGHQLGEMAVKRPTRGARDEQTPFGRSRRRALKKLAYVAPIVSILALERDAQAQSTCHGQCPSECSPQCTPVCTPVCSPVCSPVCPPAHA